LRRVPFRVSPDPAAPVVLQADLGRHPITIHAPRMPVTLCFQTLEVAREDFPVQVRVKLATNGDQVGGTEQVDIIVE
jgi:hypothetical protein